MSDVVNGVVESYSYMVLCASYFGLQVQPNEPDQPDPNFDPEGQPDPTRFWTENRSGSNQAY